MSSHKQTWGFHPFLCKFLSPNSCSNEQQLLCAWRVHTIMFKSHDRPEVHMNILMLVVRKLSSESMTFPRSLSLHGDRYDQHSGLSGSKVPAPSTQPGFSLNPLCPASGQAQQGHRGWWVSVWSLAPEAAGQDSQAASCEGLSPGWPGWAWV